MFCCFRVVHSVLRQILSLWYSKEPVVYQRVDNNVTAIESVSLDRVTTKYKIWDDAADARIMSPLEASYILKATAELPWLWIGAQSPIGSGDMTKAFEKYIVPGNTITPKFLTARYPVYYDWKYLDPVTFKEVVFPDEGITIDAPRVERPKKESQESKGT